MIARTPDQLEAEWGLPRYVHALEIVSNFLIGDVGFGNVPSVEQLHGLKDKSQDAFQLLASQEIFNSFKEKSD